MAAGLRATSRSLSPFPIHVLPRPPRGPDRGLGVVAPTWDCQAGAVSVDSWERVALILLLTIVYSRGRIGEDWVPGGDVRRHRARVPGPEGGSW